MKNRENGTGLRTFVLCILIVALLPAGLFAQLLTSPSEAFGDQLIIGIVGTPPRVLNPFRIHEVVEKEINRFIFGSGLIQQADRFGEPPALVDRYIVTGGGGMQGKEWQYVLKRNINYHDGIPLRNKDVLFTFNFLKRWGGAILNRRIDFTNVRSIQLNGDLEVRFILNRKDPNFDQKLTDIPILSSNYYREAYEKGPAIFTMEEPMGYGPFRFEVSTQNEIRLVPHIHYVFGRPFLNRVVFRFYDDEQKLVDNFIRGSVDMIEVNDRLTARRLHQILKNDIKVFTVPRPEKKVYFIQFNVKSKNFQSPRTRKAIRLAINRNEIIRRLMGQNGHVAYSLIDYTNKYFFKGLFKESYRPNQGIQILQQDGWIIDKKSGILKRNDQELSFDLIFEKNSFLEESIARSIKIHLAELGINVRPQPVTHEEKKALIEKNQFDAVIDSYSYYDVDLYNALRYFYYRVLRKRKSFNNYRSLTIERLFKGVENNSIPLSQLYTRYQIVIHQEAPVVFLFFQDKIIYAVQNRFQNIRVSYSKGKMYYYRLNPLENWFVPKVLQKYREW